MDSKSNNTTIVEMFSPAGYRLTVDFTINNLRKHLERWLTIEPELGKMGYTPFYNSSTAFIPKPPDNWGPSKNDVNQMREELKPEPIADQTGVPWENEMPSADFETEKTCPVHNVKMKRQESDKGEVWFSHKHGDKWCKGFWCEIHNEPMNEYTQKNQRWTSHSFVDENGKTQWCKGV